MRKPSGGRPPFQEQLQLHSKGTYAQLQQRNDIVMKTFSPSDHRPTSDQSCHQTFQHEYFAPYHFKLYINI